MTGLKDLHIVIAEDDSDDGEIITQSFEKHMAFIKVDLVKNGQELLDYLKENTRIPDIILTDINMPILNGIEALKRIFESPDLNRIPAFVYSTTINPTYEARCIELGTKGFLVKPFSLKGFDDIPQKIVDMLVADE